MIALADRLHEVTWATLRATAPGRRLGSDRALRSAWTAGAVVLVSLALTLGAPLWLLLLAPLWLGVPHVAADVRFLVIRPPGAVPRRLLLALFVPFGAMTLLRVAALAGAPGFPRTELVLGALAVAGAAAWAGPRVGVWLALGLVALLVPALAWPGQAALIVGHAHNFVAVALWAWWMGPRGGARWVVLGALGAALAAIGFGAFDALWFADGPPAAASGLTLAGMIDTLAPDVPGAAAPRLVMAFALMQAVHYGLWLGCIPQSPAVHTEDAPLPPSRRWAALIGDLGRVGLAAVLIGAVALPIAGLAAPTAARAGYLSLVLFHGWLELAVAAHLWASGWSPRAAG